MKNLFLFILLFPALCLAGGFGAGGLKSDSTTGAVTTITYPHHETHGGSEFSHSEIVTLGAAGQRNLLIVTPNSTSKKAHLVGSVSCTSECFVYLYEDTTTSAQGTALDELNTNRSSSKTADSVLTHTPTVTDVGTELQVVQIGKTGTVGGKGDFGGNFAQRDEWILDGSQSQYLFRVIATDADTDVTIALRWYEHTDK